MRIIEPQHLRQHQVKRRSPKKLKMVALLLLVVSGAVAWQVVKAKDKTDVPPNVPIFQNQEANTTAPAATEPTKPLKFKTFTGDEFKKLYDTFAYPNTSEVRTAPNISGNAEADKRIQDIAFRRGYRLRSAPVSPLGKTPEGFPLQEKALQPWQDLKLAAAKEGISLGLVSTFRSVDEQRLIFMQRLRATGVTVEEVAAGLADSQVESVLITTSIPGTSRHHTGYTVDFKCGNEDFNFFANTTCFLWLSKNNYENSKKHGWIPSYPPDAGDQGPEPEAWEYAWVGVDALLEK